jgi:hypothetical protein
MTKPVRMAGVVVVACLAIAIPAMASGHPRAEAAQAQRGDAVVCPLTPTSVGIKRKHHVKLRHHRSHATHHHHRHRHRKPKVGSGGTGPTGPTITCRPIPCVYSAGGPNVPTGVTLPCPPIPCGGVTGVMGSPNSATGATGATSACIPRPCPLAAGSQGTSASGVATVCPPIPVCPLDVRGQAQNAPSGTTVMCPSPPCPPLPVAGPAHTPASLHACPEVATAATVVRSARLP